MNANDFGKLRTELAGRLGLVALGNEIGRCRVFFNFAFKNDLLERPVRMGLGFDKPRLQAVVDHVYKWVKPMFKKPAKSRAGAK